MPCARGTPSTSVFGSVCERSVSESAQPFESQRSSKAVADQSFSSLLVERAHRHAGFKRESRKLPIVEAIPAAEEKARDAARRKALGK